MYLASGCPKHFGDFLSPGLVVFLLPTLYRSQPLPVINTRMMTRNIANTPINVILLVSYSAGTYYSVAA